jgi:hypothetical protein
MRYSLFAAIAAALGGDQYIRPANEFRGAGHASHPIPSTRNGQRKAKRAAAAKRRKSRGRKSAR